MFKKKLYSALLLLLTLCFSLQVLPDHAHALGEGCNLSGCTCTNCGWKYLYVSTSADCHATHIACTTCSAAYGVSTDPHTFSGDTCTLCGYTRSGSGGGDTTCSHGRYSYNCEYYNSSYHYVSQVCRDCGKEVDYFRENHSLRDSFSQYNDSYHNYESYCTECNETINSSREAHNWSYDYRSYSSTEHRVDMTCRDCDYSTTDYENHRDSNGDGRCDDCSESLSVAVTWNAGINGGTVNGSSSVTTTVTSGGVASAPGYTPVKSGYTFKGWYTSATGGNLYSTVTISAAQTFYAQFTANSYTATWNANGGIPASATTSPTYGAKLTLPTAPTRTGYAFAGWYTAASGGTQVTSATTYNTAGNVTYYAHWSTNSCTVTWNMGDGKTETTNQEYGEKVVMPSGSPVKAGHTFHGWFTAEKGGTEVTGNTTYSTAGAATYYAQFTANHYSITWDLGDGKTETTGQTYGEKLILPTEPTKDGYSFLGWFTEKDDGAGTKVDENTVYTTAGVGNYYAHWARVTKFSVSIPVVLPLALSEDGDIHAATGQAIRNGSTGDIKVSSVTVNAGNGWKLVPFRTNMAAEKVDAKKIGFSINDVETTKNGSSEALRLSGSWTIQEDGNLPLEYDAVVSAMSKSVTDESILTVVFVLEWA